VFKAILFDLDGTLLNIDMEIFLQYYFMEMIRAAQDAGYQDGKTMVEQVFSSTSLMIGDLSPSILNEEAFMGDFLPRCKYPEAEVRAFFDHFYQQYFPLLKIHCCPFPGIPEMMEGLFRNDFKVVIATNPVFPREAILQRLQWAGIGDHPYALITSYEEMHFCKPHKEYYEEICRRIGVAPQDCLMVGNDVDEDLPAGLTGMKTFLVEDMLLDKEHSNLQSDFRGKVSDMINFMGKIGS
jgi:FMN phosphatase YigB (HAD superfamily)